MSTTLSELIAFRVTPAQHRAIQEAAMRDGRSASNFIRRIVLSRIEETAKSLPLER